MKYVLLFVDTEQFANDLQAMGPAERDRAYQQADKWFADHAGKLRGGASWGHRRRRPRCGWTAPSP